MNSDDLCADCQHPRCRHAACLDCTCDEWEEVDGHTMAPFLLKGPFENGTIKAINLGGHTFPVTVAISKGDAIQIEISDDLARLLVTPPLSWWHRLKRWLGWKYPHRSSPWEQLKPVRRDETGIYFERDC